MELHGFEIDVFNVHGIKLNATSWTCPECSHTRQHNSKQKCMTVNWEKGIGTCNHCGKYVQLHTYKSSANKKKYARPVLRPFLNQFSEKLKKYIVGRGISLSALEAFKIREVKEWMPQTEKEENCIAFDYFFKGSLVNTKFRDARKNFKLVKDAEKIVFNIDSIVGQKRAVIVEGEFDVMAWWEAGIKEVVSVPNGFTLKGNVNTSYLDSYMSIFEQIETIYIGVDNDEAGRKGKDELVRRFGFEKCKIIDYSPYKDANEFLLECGSSKLADLIRTAKDIQISGVFTLEDVEDKIIDSYKNGKKRGTSTYFPELDKHWTWRETEVTMWGGYQNEGKSAFLNQLCLLRTLHEGTKVAFFSPENTPIEDFFDELIESFIGKSSDPHYRMNYMEPWEHEWARRIIKEYFFLIYPEEDVKLETILEKARYLVRKNGIRTLVIDPYNTIEHLMKAGEREDLYISRFMGQLKRFASDNDISIQLVAHQNTARPNKDDEGRFFKPTVNNTKGGGTFGDKVDNFNYVWRPNRALDYKDTEVMVGSQKIKKQKLVGVPGDVMNIEFDRRTQRFYVNGKSPFEEFDAMRTPPKGVEVMEPRKDPWPKTTELMMDPPRHKQPIDFTEPKERELDPSIHEEPPF